MGHAREPRSDRSRSHGHPTKVTGNDLPVGPPSILSVQRTAGNRAASLLAQSPVPLDLGRASSGRDVASLRTGTPRPVTARVQRTPPAVAAGLGAAIKALTLSEAVTAVGTIVSIASTVGALAVQPQNDKTGVANDAFLTPTEGDYFMSPTDRDGLAQVFRVLYFAEMETLIAEEQARGGEVNDEKQEELKQTAIGNVKLVISRYLFRQSDETTDIFVANGDGGTSKETPWGSVEVTVDGGGFFVNPENEAIQRVSRQYQVRLPDEPMKFIETVKLSLECEKDWNLTWNDDIFVRVMSLQQKRGRDGHVAVHAEVAFDWDGDTSRYEWSYGNAIEAKEIPRPRWRGSTDPDD